MLNRSEKGRRIKLRIGAALWSCWIIAGPCALAAPASFVDFEDLPPTPPQKIPDGGGDWLYTTARINSNGLYYMSQYDCAGWRSTNGYGSIFNFFYLYLDTYNSDHMGWETWGFLDIDATNAIRGNSLRYYVTGGKNSFSTNGLLVTTKSHYTNYLHLGIDPVGTNNLVGHPYLYFVNTSPTPYTPFPEAQGANRLSLYYCAPATLTNQNSSYPIPVMNVGPYNGVGGHWYHEFNVQGGGWTHALCDGHPQHNNAWSSATNFPYPSKSLRDMGTDYFTNLYRWYVSFKPHSGIGVPPYSVWYDEIEFRYDSEPQNNETICSLSATYFATSGAFEIGFADKYKDFSKSFSTYELRYSFRPIDNANWSNATPAHILTNATFKIQDRADGRFQKYSPYYQAVWAPFALADSNDTARLQPGTLIWFAVKDISQIGSDGQLPVTNSGIGFHPVDGRDYTTYSTNFDYAGDQPALPLIKRIDFRIPKDIADADGDGLPDWWEQRYYGDATAAVPANDDDGDGANNTEEFGADTHPGDSNSVLALRGLGRDTNGLSLTWTGGSRSEQYIEAGTNLSPSAGPWSVVNTNAAPTYETSSIPIAADSELRFYRITARRP